jgi:hypothetical protein
MVKMVKEIVSNCLSLSRGLKHRVTRRSHETQRKVLQAAFKKVKKLPSNFQLKTEKVEK